MAGGGGWQYAWGLWVDKFGGTSLWGVGSGSEFCDNGCAVGTRRSGRGHGVVESAHLLPPGAAPGNAVQHCITRTVTACNPQPVSALILAPTTPFSTWQVRRQL